MKFWNRLSQTLRYVLIGAFVIALLFVIFQVRACADADRRATQERIEDGQQGAALNSAKDALNTQSEVNANEVQSRELDRSNAEEIRNAEGANEPVAAPVNDAGLRSLCRRAAYRDNERCRVFRAPAN